MPRLKATIFVQALIRRAQVAGAQAFLVRRGAEDAGAVFLKINRLDGRVMILSPALGAMTGEESAPRVWTRPLGDASDETKASDYLARQIKFDPDIWIVEIEDREGRAFVDEKIV